MRKMRDRSTPSEVFPKPTLSEAEEVDLERIADRIRTEFGASLTGFPWPRVIAMPAVAHSDVRGRFYEHRRHSDIYDQTGYIGTWAQTNISHSVPHVLRGLHYQLHHPQGKLLRCIEGDAFDVAVDIRRSSPRFGHHFAHHLRSEREAVWIPPGFAHGYLTLGGCTVVYDFTNEFHAESQRAISPFDPGIDIDWPVVDGLIVSAKDRAAPLLYEAEVFP
jgi:dTDP-4-dehydrorhamnose 3,5-epimerase